MADSYWTRREEKRCTRCGEKLPEQYFYVNCVPCREKHNKQVRWQTREKREANRVEDARFPRRRP